MPLSRGTKATGIPQEAAIAAKVNARKRFSGVNGLVHPVFGRFQSGEMKNHAHCQKGTHGDVKSHAPPVDVAG